MKRWIVLSALAAALAGAGSASAHHSYAAFDRTKTVELSGTVKEWQWTNPHAWLMVDVPGAKGKLETYSLEASSPATLRRGGWNRDATKAGDKLKAVMNPRRDGSKGGNLVSITLADGTRYGRQPGEAAPRE